MTATLEDRIRDVFETDAARAPVPGGTWRGPTVGISSGPASRRRPMLMLSAVAAAVVVLVGTGYVVTRPDDSEPVAWQPAGAPYPIVDLGPATSSGHLTIAGLSRMIQVPGQPVITLTRTVEYFVGETAEEWRCQDSGGGGGCAPDWTWGHQPDVSISSSVDNRVADEDVWMWDGLPAATAYVEYVDGDRHLWQRPIAGFSAFPDVAGRDEIATAFAADGRVLGRAGGGVADAQGQVHATSPLQADIDVNQQTELAQLTSTTMRDCLTQSGATWASTNVATLPSGVVELATWSTCVASTKEVVARRVAAMGVRMFDPQTEGRQNPDSPLQPVDPANCHPLPTDPTITECTAQEP